MGKATQPKDMVARPILNNSSGNRFFELGQILVYFRSDITASGNIAHWTGTKDRAKAVYETAF